jgi:hypothetical protein
MALDARIPLMVQPVKSDLDRQQTLADIALRNQQVQSAQAEAEQKRTLGEILPQAMNRDPQAMQGVARADPELFMRLQTHFSTVDRATAEREGKKWEVAGPLLARMRTMPYEQRRPFLQQAAPILATNGWTAEELMAFDPSDAAIDSLGTAAMTVAQVLDSQKITWHQVGERGSFATDNLGNPTGEGNPFAAGASSAPPPPPAGFVIDGGGPASAPGTFQP